MWPFQTRSPSSKTVPHNLEQCMTRAVQTEAQYQFAEGVNLGR